MRTSSRAALTIICILYTCSSVVGRCYAQQNPAANLVNSSSLAATGSVGKRPSHSVTLTWKPSVPISNFPRDKVIGYIVFRSTLPHDPKSVPINSTQVTDTRFIDHDVEPGKVYYYVTRAVSASGSLSAPSNEARAEIPH